MIDYILSKDNEDKPEQKEESKMSIFCNSDSKELDIKVNDNHIYFYSDVNKNQL